MQMTPSSYTLVQSTRCLTSSLEPKSPSLSLLPRHILTKTVSLQILIKLSDFFSVPDHSLDDYLQTPLSTLTTPPSPQVNTLRIVASAWTVTWLLMYIYMKCTRKLSLSRIKCKFEIDTRKIVARTLALSVINYCLSMYGTTNSTLLARVQKLQNLAAKMCALGARKSDHANPFITQLEWLKIEKRSFSMWLLLFSR